MAGVSRIVRGGVGGPCYARCGERVRCSQEDPSVHIAPAGQRDIDILVVGEINPDIILSDPDPVPVFGEQERIVGSIVLTVGSSSAIFACGAARLGLRVAFAGVVGDDPFGRFMLESLASRGIDVSACQVDKGRPTGATVVLTSGHDRAILTALGTIGAMDVDAVPAALLARSRHVHSGSYYLQDTSRARLPGFFAAARAGGSSTSFDTNWDPSGSWAGGVDAMLRVSDLFFPNATEARAISGEADLEKAARELARIGAAGRSDGGPTIVVKRGVDGALAWSGDGQLVEVPAMPVSGHRHDRRRGLLRRRLPVRLARRRVARRCPAAGCRLWRALDAPVGWGRRATDAQRS